MYSYRLKNELIAVTRGPDGDASRVVKLEPGTIVRLMLSEAEKRPDGLVKVCVEDAAFSVFMRDLEDRAERI